MFRLVHICVIAALIVAAALVYKIKFDSTLQAEKVAKMHGKLRAERSAIAVLRADWTKLDTPLRIQGLAARHLPLQPVKATQFSNFDRLPERPLQLVPPTNADPLGAMLGKPDTTGSIPAAPPAAPARR